MDHIGAENETSLSRRQSLAIPVIAVSPSISAGARAIGVSRTTLRRWMQEPEFRAELERARQDAVQLAYSEIQALSLKSVSALSALLEDPDSRVRSSAVRTSLLLLRNIEADRDVKKRITLMEDAYDLLHSQR